MRHSGNATAARDMRKQLHIFVVEEDICVGKSKAKAKANKKYGDGGATQYYIRDMDKLKLTQVLATFDLSGGKITYESN